MKVEWKHLESLREAKRLVNKGVTLSAAVSIVQPLFPNGSRGEPRLQVDLSRNRNILRLQLTVDEADELQFFAEELRDLATKAGAMQSKLRQTLRKHEENKPRSKPRQHSGPGQGLSRFASGSKTEKKREREREGKACRTAE